MNYRANILLVTAIAIMAQAPFALADTRAQAQAAYNKGVTLKKGGDLPGALASFEEALKLLDSEDAKAPSTLRTDTLFSIGLIHKKNGDLAKAKTAFTDAIKGSSDYGPAHLGLGQILLQEGTFEDCRKEFDLAIKGKEVSAGDKAEAWNGIGISYRYESKIPEAAKAFDEAIKLDAKNWIYYVNKGIAINKSKDKALLPDGEAAYRKAAELAPDKAEPWMGIGISCRKQGKWDDSIAGYEKALKIKTDDADGWYDLASVYGKKRTSDKTLSDAQVKDLMKKEVSAWEAYLKLAKPNGDTAKNEAYVKQLKDKIAQ